VEIRLEAAPSLLREAPPPLCLAEYVSPFREANGEPVLVVWQVGGGHFFRLCYQDGTQFLIARAGNEVWATWPEPLTLDDTATYLLGPILGVVLRLRGTVCLHASAIALGSRAIALVGPAGAGKSTTAAAFAQSGVAVLSDDIVALNDQGATLFVEAGNPRLRLWPTSAQLLFGVPDALPRLTPNWDKLYLELGLDAFAFHGMALPLGAVYILGERGADLRAPFVEPLLPQEGLMHMLGNRYVTCFVDRPMRIREFEVLGRLMRCVPVRRVVSHEDPARLAALCQLIRDDFHTLVSLPGQRNGSVWRSSLDSGSSKHTAENGDLISERLKCSRTAS
jgi:hypothetical protein